MSSALATYTEQTTAMDIDTIGTNQSSSTMMDIDTPTTATPAQALEEDLLPMEIDQDLLLPTTTTPAPGQPATYKFDFGRHTTTTNDADLGILRRNIRHVDTKLRSLAKEPYPVRRAAAKDLYEQYRHLGRTVAELRSACSANDNNNIAAYVRHVTKLWPLILGLGSEKDFSKGLARLERIRLPEPRVIRIGGNLRADELRGLFAGVSI